ncbi:glycine betaine/proline transport system permease protein [Tamaricihabitans halophyticus]|uniref:Glycine betaine/proline transport system permease protein n=1 Tax=Tamaricihabitans halophyticus TaxID=1262583 RepID=A0A4R2RC67_9PSEU|nr:proline/glycine betaine ABC transporter permease [Tamaricihabitans halophyticus]TCP57321.1 glycine betaine/proline transport system permease protein [Tamaricihabitans halophyticus]
MPDIFNAALELPRIPIGQWAEGFVDWLENNLGPLLDFATNATTWAFDELSGLLTWPAPVVVTALCAVLAFVVRGWGFALFTLLGLALVASLGYFEPMMQTTALVLIASLVAIVVAVPIGILAARNRAVSQVVRPVLDLMQTLPPFVYLIPAVILFSIGATPGLLSTVVFALPPAVRLTELGIRQVDPEMVEAGQAFGAPPRQVLTGIQLPLAMPSIMAGVNQVIMLSLSMVVIAGMVGMPGLGQSIYEAVTRNQIGPGAESGLSVVILAIFLDRLTSSFGAGKGLLSRLRKPLSATSR